MLSVEIYPVLSAPLVIPAYDPGVSIIHESILPMRASVSRGYLIVFFLCFTESICYDLQGCCLLAVTECKFFPNFVDLHCFGIMQNLD